MTESRINAAISNPNSMNKNPTLKNRKDKPSAAAVAVLSLLKSGARVSRSSVHLYLSSYQLNSGVLNKERKGEEMTETEIESER